MMKNGNRTVSPLRRAAVLALIVLVAGVSSCTGSPGIRRFSVEFLDLFDTVTQVVGYTRSPEEFESIARDLYDQLAAYHRLFDIYREYESVNLKTVNDAAGLRPVEVDPRVIELLEFCRTMYAETEGTVNFAYGAVLRLWHEARERAVRDPESASIPDSKLLAEAAGHVDPRDVVIDAEAGTVFLRDPEMRLDVGAIAKGYAAEQAARYIEARYPGIPILIGIGGNIRAIGYRDPSARTPWSIGIQNPDPESAQTVVQSVYLSDASMVTSGDYQRYFEADGVSYHHIIDPSTHMPARRCRSVTIRAADSGVADALSTAAFILPHDEALALVRRFGAEAYFVFENGIEWTPDFEAYFKP